MNKLTGPSKQNLISSRKELNRERASLTKLLTDFIKDICSGSTVSRENLDYIIDISGNIKSINDKLNDPDIPEKIKRRPLRSYNTGLGRDRKNSGRKRSTRKNLNKKKNQKRSSRSKKGGADSLTDNQYFNQQMLGEPFEDSSEYPTLHSNDKKKSNELKESFNQILRFNRRKKDKNLIKTRAKQYLTKHNNNKGDWDKQEIKRWKKLIAYKERLEEAVLNSGDYKERFLPMDKEEICKEGYEYFEVPNGIEENGLHFCVTTEEKPKYERAREEFEGTEGNTYADFNKTLKEILE